MLTIFLAPFLLAAPQDPAADFDARVAHILPSAAETSWRSIPWRAELRGALVEASDADKPVLLWAMNGHPLGQT